MDAIDGLAFAMGGVSLQLLPTQPLCTYRWRVIGPIPPALGGLTSLKGLDLSSNMLSGEWRTDGARIIQGTFPTEYRVQHFVLTCWSRCPAEWSIDFYRVSGIRVTPGPPRVPGRLSTKNMVDLYPDLGGLWGCEHTIRRDLSAVTAITRKQVNLS